jgi:hypothetical protein
MTAQRPMMAQRGTGKGKDSRLLIRLIQTNGMDEFPPRPSADIIETHLR